MKLLPCLLLVALVGCSHTKIVLPTATTPGSYENTSVLTNRQAKKIQVRLEGPDKGASVEGFGGDATAVAAKALELANTALTKTP